MKSKKYKPNYFSLRKHKVPDWYKGAKLGIFVHWGLYSIPAFGTNIGKTIKEVVKEQGFLGQFKNTPYGEWYLNALRIEGSAARKYHIKNYGEDFDYYDFIDEFNREAKKWNPNEMAEVIKKSGAKYTVIVSKHHDGFLLWHSKYRNPRKPELISKRDIIAEFSDAIKKAGLKLGIYYSGTFDWSFEERPIVDPISFIQNGVTTREYVEYANSHWFELIDLFKPFILWNDIGYPPKTRLSKIFAYFYNKQEEGVINDRWIQIPKWLRWFLKQYVIRHILTWAAKRTFIKGGATMPVFYHCDFVTPEYGVFHKIKKKKWELTRGIGNSFGYNKFEKEEHHLTREELIYMFVDIVSKNGNLLLNIGPKADGSIPEYQKKRLNWLGEWLVINGDAIYDTEPWKRAEGETLDGVKVRFTKKGSNLNIIILKSLKDIANNKNANIDSDKYVYKYGDCKLIIKNLKIWPKSKIKLLGASSEIKLKWKNKKKDLYIEIEEINKVPYKVLNQPAISFIVSKIEINK
ncbi:MAG: alpha-L-fucosidase [Candidatus Helarchaeota archaeon]